MLAINTPSESTWIMRRIWSWLIAYNLIVEQSVFSSIHHNYAYFQTARWNTLRITGHTFGCRQNDCVEAHGWGSQLRADIHSLTSFSPCSMSCRCALDVWSQSYMCAQTQFALESFHSRKQECPSRNFALLLATAASWDPGTAWPPCPGVQYWRWISRLAEPSVLELSPSELQSEQAAGTHPTCLRLQPR